METELLQQKNLTTNTKNQEKTDENELIDIEIKKVKTKSDLFDFYNITKKIYKENKNYVHPLWIEMKDFFKRKNHFWSHTDKELFIAYKNNIPVGRIASFIDYNYSDKFVENIGFFGFFETINDYKIADLLLQKNCEWHRSKNTSIIYGPINGRIDLGLGFLTNDFDKIPSFMSSYNPKYYIDFIEKYGMKKSKIFIDYIVNIDKENINHLKNFKYIYNDDDILIRRFKRIHSERDIEFFIDILNKTFKNHWGYAETSQKEIKKRFGIKQARWLLKTSLFLFAEKKGKPVGFIFSLPDYNQILHKFNGKFGIKQILYFLINQKKINRGKMYIIGIIGKNKNKNIATKLNYQTLKNMEKLGYKEVIVGPVDNDNIQSKRIIQKMNGKLSKQFFIYEQRIKREEN